jgi:hypothetical protein
MPESNTCLFLSGADMDPTAVLAAHPGARFVARARVRADQYEIAAPFAASRAGDGSAEVWGILIEKADAGSDNTRQAVTDEGRAVDAVVGGQLASGEPDKVLAAARYWELPPAYVGRLRDAIAAVEGAPSDED